MIFQFGTEIQLSRTFRFLLTSHVEKVRVRLKGTEPKAHPTYYIIYCPVADSNLNFKVTVH